MSWTHPHRTSGSSLPASLPTALPPQLVDWVTCIQSCGNLWNQSCSCMSCEHLGCAAARRTGWCSHHVACPCQTSCVMALLPLFLLSRLFCYFLHSSNSSPLLIVIESSHLSSASSFGFNVFHNKHRRRNKPVIYFYAHICCLSS